MSGGVAELTERYYRDFARGGDFESVPMGGDLRFTGPVHAYVGGERYRRDCVALAATVRGFAMRHQFVDGDQAHSVYDLDLGLPSGPIPSSETLTFSNGVLVAADLLIDSTPLRAIVDES